MPDLHPLVHKLEGNIQADARTISSISCYDPSTAREQSGHLNVVEFVTHRICEQPGSDSFVHGFEQLIEIGLVSERLAKDRFCERAEKAGEFPSVGRHIARAFPA